MLKHKLTGAVEWMENILQKISVVCLLLIMLGIAVEVFARKFFDLRVVGLIDITEEYLLMGLVFFSMSYVYKVGGHVRVTLVTRLLSPGIKSPINIIFNFISLCYFLLIVIFSWRPFVRAIEKHEVAGNILEYPMAPSYFLVPLGCAFVCFRIIQYMFASFEEKSETSKISDD